MSLPWSQLCTDAQQRPLPSLLTDLYAWGGTLVCPSQTSNPFLFYAHIHPPADLLIHPLRHHPSRRLRSLASQEPRGQDARVAGVRDSTLPSVCFCNNRFRYGLFTALSCAGSITGAIAYSARIGHLYGVYASRDIELRGNLSPAQFQQVYALRAQELRFCAAHFATHPLESGVVIIAQLLVLHRMQKLP